jgi:hypothetical protein
MAMQILPSDAVRAKEMEQQIRALDCNCIDIAARFATGEAKIMPEGNYCVGYNGPTPTDNSSTVRDRTVGIPVQRMLNSASKPQKNRQVLGSPAGHIQ